MKYWCLDCAIAGGVIYGSIKYGLLSQNPEYLGLQITGIIMAAKPVTTLAMSYLEGMGLKTM